MKGEFIVFQYADQIIESFPAVIGGTVHGRTVQNGPSSEALKDLYLEEQQSALLRYQDLPMNDIPSIQAWRKVFQAFGVKPTQYRNAAEALIRRLTKHGDVPSINSLVDIANMISLRYALPVAIFDLKEIRLPISVRFADGSERFTPLGASQAEAPKNGEVIFADETGLAVARRWCWRQSDDSASRGETVEILATIEGHHEFALADVQSAREDLTALLKEHIGGTYTEGLVTVESPEFFSS
jgi:DNA/RNA-binding domain of Phe-tRNA-synthetase-like protein